VKISWEETLVNLEVFLWEFLSTDPVFSISKNRVFGSRKVRKFKKIMEDWVSAEFPKNISLS